MKNERQGRMTFYNMMILEASSLWCGPPAYGVVQSGSAGANASLATGTIGVVCKDILGPWAASSP